MSKHLRCSFWENSERQKIIINLLGTTKKCESKNVTYFFLFIRDWDGKGEAAIFAKISILTY